MAGPELALTYMSGARDGEVVRLAAAEVTFGRSEACTVRIEHDTEVSREHTRLCWRNGGWWLEDLRSTNGTYLGEFGQAKKVLSPVQVTPGQIFRLGATRFRLEDPAKFSNGTEVGSKAEEPKR